MKWYIVCTVLRMSFMCNSDIVTCFRWVFLEWRSIKKYKYRCELNFKVIEATFFFLDRVEFIYLCFEISIIWCYIMIGLQ
jgi:hypothetical protein